MLYLKLELRGNCNVTANIIVSHFELTVSNFMAYLNEILTDKDYWASNIHSPTSIIVYCILNMSIYLF